MPTKRKPVTKAQFNRAFRDIQRYFDQHWLKADKVFDKVERVCDFGNFDPPKLMFGLEDAMNDGDMDIRFCDVEDEIRTKIRDMEQRTLVLQAWLAKRAKR